MTQRLFALLGRRDSPTDGVYDYCQGLGSALSRFGFELQLTQVPWMELGWWDAARWVRTQTAAWKGRWVLLQYTSLSWSRNGIPIAVLPLLQHLRHGGARSAVVFHDALGFGGGGLISQSRRTCQHLVMTAAYRLAERSIVTVPLDRIRWLPASREKAVFIPVGSGVSETVNSTGNWDQTPRARSVVAVFGVTGGEHMRPEVSQIADAIVRVRHRVQNLHLVVMGRGSEEAKDTLWAMLGDKDVSVSVMGVLPDYEVRRVLSQADVLLFVRGHVSSRRSSAIAGICCGVPVVGYEGPETGPPLTEAGVVLVPEGDQEGLVRALSRVLTDERWRCHLREQARDARLEHFSWEAISRRFLEIVR